MEELGALKTINSLTPDLRPSEFTAKRREEREGSTPAGKMRKSEPLWAGGTLSGKRGPDRIRR
jgi:hypothetical protein